MLTDEDLDLFCLRNKFSRKQTDEIKKIKKESPSRRVDSGIMNITVRYCSKKMGFVIQAESFNREFPHVIQFEYDNQIFAYFDQPPQKKIYYKSLNGKRGGWWITFDFFIIRKDGTCAWIEVKDEQALIELAKKMPNRYIKDGDIWRSPPAEEMAAEYGFEFIILTEKQIKPILVDNLRYLSDYFLTSCPMIEIDITDLIIEFVKQHPAIKLNKLYDEFKDLDRSIIHKLIVDNAIYINIEKYDLRKPKRVPVFVDQAVGLAHEILPSTKGEKLFQEILTINPGDQFKWGENTFIFLYEQDDSVLFTKDGEMQLLKADVFYEMVNVGAINSINYDQTDENNELILEILSSASIADLLEANRRCEILSEIENGEKLSNFGINKRTHKRWEKRYNNAKEVYGYGYIGLIPKHGKKGNRDQKAPSESLELAEEIIEEKYEEFHNLNKTEAYGNYENACDKKSVTPVSSKTFNQMIRERDKTRQIKEREGRKAANTIRPRHRSGYKLSKKGFSSWNIGHIDSTPPPVAFVCGETGIVLGSAQDHFLFDDFSSKCMAVISLFEPPSYRATLLLYRMCVLLHNRLPDYVVLDAHPSYSSIAIETFSAFYGINKTNRRKSMPIDGAPVESPIATITSQFYSKLAGAYHGNNPRAISPEVSPTKKAVWDLQNYHTELNRYIFDEYNNNPKQELGGLSPNQVFQMGLEKHGHRKHKEIKYDDVFKFNIMPSVKGGRHPGKRKIIRNDGIKNFYSYYWNNNFYKESLIGSYVPVKYNPFSIETAHAYIPTATERGKWIECESDYKYELQGCTEYEISCYTEELKRRDKIAQKSYAITAKRLANFRQELNEKEEQLYKLRLKNLADKKTLQDIFPDENIEVLPSEAPHPNPNIQFKTPNPDELPVFEEI